MASATYAFYVDWNGDNDFLDDYEDISAYVFEASWSYGRDHASQLTGKSIAGLCTLLLKNTDKRFSPFNTSSPLYGSLLPGRKIKITMTVGASTVTMFSGFLDSIDPEKEIGGRAMATLRGIGGLGIVAQKYTTIAMQTNALTGTVVGLILDDAGWPAGATYRDIDAGQTTMSRCILGQGRDAFNAARDIEETEAGFLRETKDGKIAFEDRLHRLAAPHTVSQATYSDTAGATLGYRLIEEADPLKEIYNVIEVHVQLYTVNAIATLWTLPESSADSTSPAISAGQTLNFWAQYPNPASAVEAVGVDAWTTPASGVDYLANAQADGGGANLTADISIAATKFDKAMKLAVTNGGAGTAYLTVFRARGTAVIEKDTAPIIDEDTASQGKYGKRHYPAPAKFIPSTASARDYAGMIRTIYGSPIPFLTIGFPANRSTAHLSEAQVRDVSDRVTITATGDASLGINEDFYVEAIHHSVKREKDHTVILECSPAAPYSGFWTLDQSGLGQGTHYSMTILAY